MNEMASAPYGSPSNTVSYTVRPPRTYTAFESVLAWCCMLAGYLFCRCVPLYLKPLSGFLWVTFMFAALLIYLFLKKIPVSGTSFAALGSALVINSGLLLSADAVLWPLCLGYAVLCLLYVLYSSHGNALHSGASDLVLVDVFRAAVIVPFSAHGNPFAAMFSGKATRGGKAALKLLIGLAVAVIPTAVVLGLLSYDDGFTDLLSGVFDMDLWDVFSHGISIGFGIPIGAYLFGALIGNTDKEAADTLTYERCHRTAHAVRVAPMLTVAAATVPLLLVYGVFFVSQGEYYCSAFTGVLPEKFSYAAYAREGFFQLCAVSCINMAMILAALLLTRRSSAKPCLFLRILTVVYSLATLVLIATAISKMVLYIQAYGLTQKRVYATWFMAVLTLVFLVIALSQFTKRIKAIFTSAAIAVGMFAALVVCDVNSIIAEYNVNAYMNGRLQTVDVQSLEDLGDSAVPALCRLYDSPDNSTPALKRRTANTLQVLSEQHEENDTVWSFTVPKAKAAAALKACSWKAKDESL